MPAAVPGGILRRMKFTPDQPAPAADDPRSSAPEAPDQDGGEPEQPQHDFDPNRPADVSLGERRTYTLPVKPLGWSRPDADLKFTMVQLTLSERCRAFRISVDKLSNTVSTGDLGVALVKASIVQIGENENPGTDEVDRWWTHLDAKSVKLLSFAYDQLHSGTDKEADEFTASQKLDPARRRHGFTFPASLVPPRRWAARSYLGSATADLSFTMQELTVRDEQAAANAVDDLDDNASHRCMQILFSVRSVGGVELDNSPANLETKRLWLEDIGPKAYKFVTGVYAQLHEVDRALVERFLESAESPAGAP